MKKHFRLISALLAACMSLTMAAGAANIAEDEPAATHAGDVISGTVYIHDEDGEVVDTVPYEVEIPVDASKQDEVDLIGDAAATAYQSTLPMTRTNINNMIVLDSVADKALSKSYKSFFSYKLKQSFDEIAVGFIDLEGVSSVTVKVTGSGSGGFTAISRGTSLSSDEGDVHIFAGERCDDDADFFAPDKGVTLNVKVKANASGSCTALLFGI